MNFTLALQKKGEKINKKISDHNFIVCDIPEIHRFFKSYKQLDSRDSSEKLPNNVHFSGQN